MPKITVLTITARSLYAKEQADALRYQTFDDFEWVVVDTNNLNYAVLVDGDFPLIHIGDREKRDYFAAQTAYNWGLAHSSGELVFFMQDYVLPHPECLARHWDIYSKYKDVFISGRSYRINMTPDAFDVSRGKVDAKDYRAGINTEVELEPDLLLVKNSLSPTWWSGRNDSAPLQALLDCNGFEEDLDGRWGGGDGELANRLVTYGLYYVRDKKSLCLEFKHTSGDRRSIRTKEDQLELASNLSNTKHEQGIYRSNVERDLWKERAQCLSI